MSKSVFDDNELLQQALEKIQLLQDRLTVNPDAKLSVDEREFLVNMSSVMDFDESPIQVEKIKRVNPFSKMVMSATQTFNNAKKAFNVWMNKSELAPEDDVKPDVNHVSLKEKIAKAYNQTVENVENRLFIAGYSAKKTYQDIAGRVSDGVSSAGNKATAFVDGVVGGVNKKVDAGIDAVASGLTSAENSINKFGTNVKDNFFDTYDKVAVAAMKKRTALENGVINTKNKVSQFMEKFEDPWIDISIGGFNLKNLDFSKSAYSAGLFAGKAAQKIGESLSNFREGFIKAKKLPKEEPIMERNAVYAQDEKGVQVNNDEVNKVADLSEGSIIGTNVKPTAQVEVPEPTFMAQDVNPVKPEVVKNIEVPQKKGFLARMLSAFKGEDKSAAKIDLNDILKREDDGLLPSATTVWKRTEAIMVNKIGITINDKGNYDFSKLNSDASGNRLPAEVRVDNIEDKVIPVYFDELKKSLVQLEKINEKMQKNKNVKLFDALVKATKRDESYVFDLIEKSKTESVARENIEKLGVQGAANFLKDVDKNLMDVREQKHLLGVAVLSVSTLLGAGKTISAELFEASKECHNGDNVYRKFVNTVVMTSNSGKELSHSNVIGQFNKKDFSATLEENSEIKIRISQFQANLNEEDLRKEQAKKQALEDSKRKVLEDRARMVEEKGVAENPSIGGGNYVENSRLISLSNLAPEQKIAQKREPVQEIDPMSNYGSIDAILDRTNDIHRQNQAMAALHHMTNAVYSNGGNLSPRMTGQVHQALNLMHNLNTSSGNIQGGAYSSAQGVREYSSDSEINKVKVAKLGEAPGREVISMTKPDVNQFQGQSMTNNNLDNDEKKNFKP